MQVEQKKLEKSQLELTIIVAPAEMEKWLKKAATHLSEHGKIPGFRPGKAPYETVVKQFGEMKVYEEALDDIITFYYWQAVTENKINTIGQPKIDISKFAPGNDLVFTAQVALLPGVTIGNYQNLQIEKKKGEVLPAEIDKVLKELQEMRVKEAAKLSAAEMGDKAEVSFSAIFNGVPLENGQAEKYPLVLGSKQMIPGFEEQIVGMNVGQEKKFTINFPAEYYKKELAGQPAEFTVKVTNLYHRELPELNDEFAQQVAGVKDLAELRNKVKENMQAEKDFKEEQKAEIEMLEKIVEHTTFGELPEILVHSEQHKMIHELQDSIEAQGMVWDHYLSSIKKDEHSLEHDFLEGAIKRVKTALIMREVAQKENIMVSQEEVQAEIKKLAETYRDNETVQNNLQSDGYRKYLENSLNNEKVLQFLKEHNIKK